MDTESRNRFAELVKKQPHELTETDVEFLKSRETYLSDDERKVFAKVLTAAQNEDESDSEDRPKSKKK